MKANNLAKINGLSDLERQKQRLHEQIDMQEMRIEMDVKIIKNRFESVGTLLKSVQVGFGLVKSLLKK